MTPSVAGIGRAAAWLCLAALAAVGGSASGQSTGSVAYRLLDLSNAPIASVNEAVLDRPVQPGSLMKWPVLVAALETRAISPQTRVACPGFAEIDGRRVACVHPRVRRALTAAEALSYSCNTYFAAVGARLSRARLDAVLATLGLPATPSGAAMPRVATGLAATPVAPSALGRALLQVVADASGTRLRPETRSVVVEGLRGAAVFGTAAAFGAKGIEALAATGAVGPEVAASRNIVLAAWPASHPTRAIVLVGGETAASASELAARVAVAQPEPGGVARDAQRSGAAGVPPARPPAPNAGAGVTDWSALTLRVGFATPTGYDVRVLRLEDYVARVLAGEAAPRSAPAALEALAITVRTFALANRARHRRDGFDLCALTHCQVLRDAYPAARAAAAATTGQVLAWHGAAASVFYTASCGGTGERPSNVWPGAVDPPFLPSRHDSGCVGLPPWSVEIPAVDLQRALASGGFSGRAIRDVRVRTRSESGRVMALAVDGLEPGEVSGQVLRMLVGRTLGWRLIKSTDFQVARTSSGYRFTGRGFGHGVGFCVIGATRRAAAGASRASLLEQYFPGLAISRLSAGLLGTPPLPEADPAVPLASGDAATEGLEVAPPEPDVFGAGDREPPARREPPVVASRASPATAGAAVAVELPELDDRDRAYVAAMAERLLASAAARAGRSVPTGVRLVFHSTVDGFVRTTREPAWAPASTSGTRIDLQPYVMLRERGDLEATLALEAGHVVTGTLLTGRARWVREGAAMFAAGVIGTQEISRARRLGPPAECPPDPSFADASRQVAQAALDKARACFARALGANLRWDEVR